MSDTVGIIVIVVGIAISAVGMWYLARTRRQVLGLAILVVGLMGAGTGLLTIEDTEVTERTPATIESGAATPATPES